MPSQLHAAALGLEDWVKNQAIPLWRSRGFNQQTGLHYERLFANGEVDYASDLRARVQARQAFFYAVASHYGWCPDGHEIAQKLLRNVKKNAGHPAVSGNYSAYCHLMDKNGKVIDAKQDLYDHAFFILANAWSYRISGDESALIEAEQIVAHLDKKFSAVNGGWIEGDYDYSCRRQNPHMHLFEAFMALYDATGNAKWLAKVDAIFLLFETHFFDKQKNVLFEFYQDDWQRCADKKGDIVEPGHMMEWVWLLDWYSRRSGKPVKHYTRILFDNALAIGMDKSGLLFDAVNYSGQVIDAKKRCWCMTELIKASLVQIREGHPKAEAIAVKAVNDLFKYYLCASTPGSFIDQRGEHNEILVDLAPASTLYHLIVAAVELRDHCDGKYER
jgi:mannose/cellobiose epimerase-like protein (N-acyl-D-glucosamine 2-epimerase family)